MHASRFRSLGLAAATLVLLASAADAQGKGKDKDKDKKGSRNDGEVARISDARYPVSDPRRPDRNAGGDIVRIEDARDVVLDPRRAPVDPRRDGRADTRGRRIPPGLAKKPGGMPPGQYKKMYGTRDGAVVLRDVLGRRGYTVLRTADAGESQYVYYRLRDGSTRRAVVSPGSERLQFSNVPSPLLSEVLSRLY